MAKVDKVNIKRNFKPHKCHWDNGEEILRPMHNSFWLLLLPVINGSVSLKVTFQRNKQTNLCFSFQEKKVFCPWWYSQIKPFELRAVIVLQGTQKYFMTHIQILLVPYWNKIVCIWNLDSMLANLQVSAIWYILEVLSYSLKWNFSATLWLLTITTVKGCWRGLKKIKWEHQLRKFPWYINKMKTPNFRHILLFIDKITNISDYTKKYFWYIWNLLTSLGYKVGHVFAFSFCRNHLFSFSLLVASLSTVMELLLLFSY